MTLSPPRGLSPPTRGNPPRQRQRPTAPRSIPAHAGEPVHWQVCPVVVVVYPRPRGGTRRLGISRIGTAGLSPPTRGNPIRAAQAKSPAVVYPRPRGGTAERRTALLQTPRSIPAHAGEPCPSALSRPRRGVYPRPRGGTRHHQVDFPSALGLSPPTRGNHRQGVAADDAGGSIPAHAGEPGMGTALAGAERVYPRPRGGTRPTLSSPT